MTLTTQRLRLPLAIIALVLVASAPGCNDAPTTIGSDYLPENVEFRNLTLGPGNFSVTSGISTLSNNSSEGGTGVLVGRAPDGSVAHGLLAFTTSSTVLTGSAAQPVTAASLALRSYGYIYGDTAAKSTSFDVVVLDGTMSQNAQFSPPLVTAIESAPTLGTFTGAVPKTGAINVTLDAASTQAFLRSYLQFDTVNGVPRTTVLKHLALRARSDAGSVAGFIGVTFLGLADSMKPTLNVTAGTNSVQLRSEVASWIGSLPLAPGPGKFMVAGGAPIRSHLRIRLDSLPTNAVIHKAELLLHVDTANSRGGTMGIPTYFVAFLSDDSTAASTTFRTGSASFIVGNRLVADTLHFSDVVSFPTIGPVITTWARSRRAGDTVKRLLPNNGLILALNRNTSNNADQESASLDRVVFFGPDAADPALRPSLKITYSILRADAQ